jgi:hypothetical protein
VGACGKAAAGLPHSKPEGCTIDRNCERKKTVDKESVARIFNRTVI